MTESPIPLCDLRAQYASIKSDVDKAILDVVESCAFIKGPAVFAFENAYAEAHGLPHGQAIGCSSGTSALTAALIGLGLPEGAEIILPSHSFFATVESVVLAGCTPVFADIKPSDYTIDPDRVESLITDRTKAIVPVHIYGTMADMDALLALAKRHDLFVVEDSAQAHLATWNGVNSGAVGDAGAFSFYPGKNLGAYGDAGMIVSRHADVATRIRKYIDHGRQDKYLHDLLGDNMRMDSIQAAVLNIKLKHLPHWSASRRDVAKQYDEAFRPLGFKSIEPDDRCQAVYHLYVVEVSNRDEVMAALKANGIASGIHYPTPIHAQPALQGKTYRASALDVTTRIVDRIVSLPIYPEMTPAQISRVIDTFQSVAEV